MKSFALLFLWIFLSVNAVFGEHEGVIWNYEHLSKNDGLSSNRITALCDDRYGRIWIGTSQGLDIYDSHSVRKVASYAGLEICSLHDTGDKILICTSRYVESYDYGSGRFSRLTYDGRDVGYVRTILHVDSTVLLKTQDRLFRCEGGGLALVADDTPYVGMCSDKFGQLWGLSGDKVYRIGESFDVTGTYQLNSIDRSPLVGVCLYADSKGSIWVGTVKDGLYRYNRARDEFIREPIALQFGVPEIENICGMNEDCYDRLWIGHNNGVSVYDYNNDYFCNYVCERNDNAVLNTVVSVFRTRRQNMLLGTYFSGLFSMGELDSGVEYHTLGSAGTQRTQNVTANGILRDDSGNWWVATNSTGINVLDGSGNFIRRISSVNRGINDNIIALQRDVRGDLWAGSLSSGLYRLRSDGTMRHYMRHPDHSGSLSGSNIQVLHALNADTLFVAHEKGIDIYRYASDDFITLCRCGEEDYAFYDVHAYGDRVYFVNFGSVLCYDRSTGEVSEWVYPERSDLAPYFQCGWMDSSGVLWLGTTKGEVWRFERGDFEPVVEGDRMINGGIASMRGDVEGNIWMAAGKDLFRLDSLGVLRRFSLSKGMGIHEFNVRSAYVGDDGEICFGTTNGLACFRPEVLGRAAARSVTLLLSGLRLFNEPVAVGDKVLKSPLNEVREIVLSHNQTFVTFEVSVIDYDIFRSSSYMCRYRLENFDDNWYELGPQREISYTGLPSGRYRLVVQLLGDDGTLMEEHELGVRVRAPLLLRAPMIGVYVILSGLLIWFFIRLARRQRQVRSLVETARREQETRARIDALKLDFFSYITYEFKTPLSIISTLQDSVLPPSSGSDPGSDSEIIRRNIERLGFLVDQLMDFRNIESRNIALAIRKYDFVPFLNRIYQSFAPLYDRKQISHIFESEVRDLPILFDAAKMEMMLGNLFGYTFKSVQAGGDISLRLREEGQMAVIELFNSGPCMTDEQRQAVFRSYDRGGLPDRGIGLALVQSIAHLFNIGLSVEAVADRGNVFRVEIPITRDDGAATEQPDSITGIVDRIVDNTIYFEEASEPCFLDAEGHRKFRILLVEDDADSKLVLAKRLHEHFHVSSAATGDEALLMLKTLNVDVVICDMQLSGTSGADLCAMIKKSNRTRHIPVILESFDLTGENRIRALQCGADAVFEKPINLQELFLQLNNLLRTKDVLRDYYMAAGGSGVTAEALNNTDERFVLTVTNYIYGHLDDPNLSVNNLAQHANVSRTRLYLYMKRLMGQTPSDFILQIKMQEAAKMLQTTDKTSSEISYRLGYCNPNHFSRQFKSYYGVSPSEYKRTKGRSK